MLSSFANTVIATQSLNIVLHLLVFPIVSLRDTDAPTNVPTSVEYNIQTNSIVGVLSYGSALWFLLSAEETTANPIAKWLVSYCDWNQQLIALCIAACYEFNGIIFASFYCQPYAKKSLNKTFQAVSVPVYVLSLLLLILVPGNEKYMNYITVAGSSFFMFRMLLMILDYIHSSTATTVTYPKETNVTMGIQRQPSSKSVTVPETSSNIWKIYGHEYDVTDFVQHHPGGVESIMLAANRHDCTALFQSYHAFNIHKAKAVLEKYRISPTPTSNEDKDKKLLGSYPVGHHNDLFYEELVKRVSKVLRDNGIDPVKDRYASWERYFMYLVIVSSIVTCGYYHVKVRTAQINFTLSNIDILYSQSTLSPNIYARCKGHFSIKITNVFHSLINIYFILPNFAF
jgi:cytochrome b involved in lipid metabolism